MKKIVCLVLVLTAVICCLASCDARYIPVAGFTVVGPYVTVLELPTKELGGETTLEFWIGENLTDNDISGHTKVYDGFLGEGYGLDENKELMHFADMLEKATVDTIESGIMTGDLYLISTLENRKKVNTTEFLVNVNK